GHFVNVAVGLGDGVAGRLPTGRVADADGGSHGVRIVNRAALHNGGGPGGLESKHARQSVRFFGRVIFLVAFPVGGDVAGVADRQEMKVGRIAELIADLESGGFLAFDADGIDAVDHFDFAGFAQFADDAQGGIEVSLDGDGDSAVHEGL